VLTIFSVVLLPLTLITGFFGMNVRFPGFDSGTGFLVTIGAMVVVVVSMLGFFRWKKWL
jgi:magnesium transporter